MKLLRPKNHICDYVCRADDLNGNLMIRCCTSSDEKLLCLRSMNKYSGLVQYCLHCVEI